VCRITGTAVFSGVSGYMAYNAATYAGTRGAKAVQLGMAAVFAGLAVARWRTD